MIIAGPDEGMSAYPERGSSQSLFYNNGITSAWMKACGEMFLSLEIEGGWKEAPKVSPQRRGGSLFIEGKGIGFPSYLLLNGLNPLSYKLCWGQSPCSTITSVAHVIITLQTLERNIITLQTLERNGSYITNFILLLQHDVIINHPHIQLGDGLIELTQVAPPCHHPAQGMTPSSLSVVPDRNPVETRPQSFFAGGWNYILETMQE